MSETATETKPEPTSEQTAKLAQTGQLFTMLAQDKKYRDRVLSLVKEANPDVYIPELEVKDQAKAAVSEEVKPLSEKADKLEKELAELKGVIARREWAAQTGLAQEEIVEIESLAKEAGITKAETALEHWQMKQRLGSPRATPASKAGDEYLQKVRKVDPRSPNGPQRLKQLAIEEGQRIQREMRGRRAG